MKPFGKYRRFTRNSISRLLSYRANVLLFLFGNILQTVVLFYLWRAVYLSSGQAVLRGFGFPEMVVYLVATTAVLALTRAEGGEIIAEEIREGSIAMNLVRPLDYRTRIFFDALGTSAYNLAFVGLPALAAILVLKGIWGAASPDLLLLPFLPALLLSFLLNFFYDFCFGLVAFVTTNMWGMKRLEMVVATLLSGGLVPLAFFPDWLRGFAGLLPWASMGYIPVMVLLGKLQGRALLEAFALQILWLAFFWWLSGLAWKRLVRRLAVNGG